MTWHDLNSDAKFYKSHVMDNFDELVDGSKTLTSLNINGNINLLATNNEIRWTTGDGIIAVNDSIHIKVASATTAFSIDSDQKVEFNVKDNTSDAFVVQQGSNKYIAITTANGNEAITWGSSAINPSVAILGDLNPTNGNVAMRCGADNGAYTISDSTTKAFRMAAYHYDTSEENMCVIFSQVDSSDSAINVGGGTSQLNAATDINFYTAGDQVTTTGTKRASIDEKGQFIFEYQMIMKEQSTASSTAGYGTLYTKSDNNLYFIDGGGTTHTVSFV